MSSHISNIRPKPDADIADYANKAKINSAEAYNTARLCLMDTLGCGFEALSYPACTKLMRPVVPGAAQRRFRAARFDAGRGVVLD